MTSTTTVADIQGASGSVTLGDTSTRAKIAELGLAFVPAASVHNVDQARARVRAAGDAAVLKVDSDQVIHKSEHGLVRLDVDERTLSATYVEITKAAEALQVADGNLVVQPMAPRGLDLFVGVSRDDTLGHVVMVGLGGVTVELFKDVSRRLAPVDRDEALAMLGSLATSPLITGWRGSPSHDTEQLASVLVAVSQFAAAHPNLAELDLNPVRLYPDGSYLVLDARSTWSDAPPPGFPSEVKTPADLRPLFEPSSIAVVGASRDPRRPGGRLLRALTEGGFRGSVFPVNPRGVEEINGLAVFPDLDAIPDAPDLVCLAVSADVAEPLVAQCASKGVGAVVLLASGYSESGAHGTEREDGLRRALAGSRTALCGPNTIGLANPSHALLATFSQGMASLPARDSGVCVVAQSGAVVGSLVSRETARGYGIGSWVTVGNQVDLDVADYLNYFVEQPSTNAIALFLEGVRDGRRLRAALACAREAGIPVAVFKTGLTEAGSRAVSAHSGALAGNGEGYRALFRQERVAHVEELTALLEVAWTLGHNPTPKADGVAVVSTSGGAGSAVVDIAATSGLRLSTFGVDTQRALEQALPALATVANPLDVTAEGAFNPDTFTRTIDALQRDPDVGLICLVLTSISGEDAVLVADAIASAPQDGETCLLVTWLIDPSLASDGMRRLVDAGVRIFDEPARMVAAAGHLLNRPRSTMES